MTESWAGPVHDYIEGLARSAVMGVEGDQQLLDSEASGLGRRGPRPWVFMALAAALAIMFGSVVLVRAQSSDRPQNPVATPPSGLAVSWTTTAEFSGMTALVNGTLARESNCLLLVSGDQSYPVVWPNGTTWVDGDARLHLASSQAIAIGQTISGGGGFESIDAVSATVGPDQAEHLRPCTDPAGDQVAVFNPDASLTTG